MFHALLSFIGKKIAGKFKRALLNRLSAATQRLREALRKLIHWLKWGSMALLVVCCLALVVYIGMQIQAVLGIFGSFQGKITVNVERFQTLTQDKQLYADSLNTNALKETYFKYIAQTSYYQMFNLTDVDTNHSLFEKMFMKIEGLDDKDIAAYRKKYDGIYYFKKDGVLGLYQFDNRYIYSDANKNPLRYLKPAVVSSATSDGNWGSNVESVNSYFRDYYNKEKSFMLSEDLLSEMNKVMFGDFGTAESITYPEAFAKPLYFVDDYMRIQTDSSKQDYGKPYVYVTQRVTKDDISNTSSPYYNKFYLEGLIKKESTPSNIVYDYAVVRKNTHLISGESKGWTTGTDDSKKTVNIGNISQYGSVPVDIRYEDGTTDQKMQNLKLYWKVKESKPGESRTANINDDNYTNYFDGPYTRLNSNGTIDESSKIPTDEGVHIDINGNLSSDAEKAVWVYQSLNKYPRKHLQVPSLTDDNGNVSSSSRMLFNKRYIQRKALKDSYRASPEYYSQFSKFIDADTKKLPPAAGFSKWIHKVQDAITNGASKDNSVCNDDEYKAEINLPFSQRKCSIIKEYTGSEGLAWIKGKIKEVGAMIQGKSATAASDAELAISPEGIFQLLLAYEDYLIENGQKGVVWDYKYYSASQFDYNMAISQFDDSLGFVETFFGGESNLDNFVRYKEPFDAVKNLSDASTMSTEYTPVGGISGYYDRNANYDVNGAGWGWKITSDSDLSNPSKVKLQKVYGEASLEFPTYDKKTLEEFAKDLTYVYGNVAYGERDFKYEWKNGKITDRGNDDVNKFYAALNDDTYITSDNKRYKDFTKQYEDKDVRNQDYVWNPNLAVYRPKENNSNKETGTLVNDKNDNGKATFRTQPSDSLPLEVKSVRDYGLGSILSYIEGRRVVYNTGVYMDEFYNDKYVENFMQQADHNFPKGSIGYYPKELLNQYPELLKNMRTTTMPVENLTAFANMILSLQRDVSDEEVEAADGWGNTETIKNIIRGRTVNGYSIGGAGGESGTYTINGTGNKDGIGGMTFLSEGASGIGAFAPYLSSFGSDAVLQFNDPIEYYLDWFDFAQPAENIFDKTFRFLSGKGLTTQINPGFTSALKANKENESASLVDGYVHSVVSKRFDMAGTKLVGKYKDAFYSQYAQGIEPMKLFDESQSEKVYLIEEAATFLGTFMYTYKDEINQIGSIDPTSSTQIINLAFSDRYFYLAGYGLALEKYKYQTGSVKHIGEITYNEAVGPDAIQEDKRQTLEEECEKYDTLEAKQNLIDEINQVDRSNELNWASKSKRITDVSDIHGCVKTVKENNPILPNLPKVKTESFDVYATYALPNKNIGSGDDYQISSYSELVSFLNSSGLSDGIKKKLLINMKVYDNVSLYKNINNVFFDYSDASKEASFYTERDVRDGLNSVSGYPVNGNIALDSSGNPNDMDLKITYTKGGVPSVGSNRTIPDSEREQIAKALYNYFSKKYGDSSSYTDFKDDKLKDESGDPLVIKHVKKTGVSDDRDSLRYALIGADRKNYGNAIPLFRHYAGQTREIMPKEKGSYFDGEELANWQNRMKQSAGTSSAKVKYIDQEREQKESYIYSYLTNFETYVPLNVKSDQDMISRAREIYDPGSNANLSDTNNSNVTAAYMTNILNALETKPWTQLLKNLKQDKNSMVQLISGMLEEQIKSAPVNTIKLINADLKGKKNTSTVIDNAANQGAIKQALLGSISTSSTNVDISKTRKVSLKMSDGESRDVNMFFYGPGCILYDLGQGYKSISTADIAPEASMVGSEKFQDVSLEIGESSDQRADTQNAINYVTVKFGKLINKYGTIPEAIMAYYYGEDFTEAMHSAAKAAGKEDNWLSTNDKNLVAKALETIASDKDKGKIIANADKIDTSFYTTDVVTKAMTYVHNSSSKATIAQTVIKPASTTGFPVDQSKRNLSYDIYKRYKKSFDAASAEYGIDKGILVAIANKESGGSPTAGLCTSQVNGSKPDYITDDNASTLHCVGLPKSGYNGGGGMEQIHDGFLRWGSASYRHSEGHPYDISFTAKDEKGKVVGEVIKGKIYYVPINLNIPIDNGSDNPNYPITASVAEVEQIRKNDVRLGTPRNEIMLLASFLRNKISGAKGNLAKGIIRYNGGSSYLNEVLAFYDPRVSDSPLDLSTLGVSTEQNTASTSGYGITKAQSLYKVDTYKYQNSGIDLYQPRVGANKDSVTTLLKNATSYNVKNENVPTTADQFDLFNLFSKDAASMDENNKGGDGSWLGLDANITSPGIYSPAIVTDPYKNPLAYMPPLMPFHKLFNATSYGINTWFGWDDWHAKHTSNPNHTGLDIVQVKGSGNIDMYAAIPGTVTKVITGCVQGTYSCGSGYGNQVAITYDFGAGKKTQPKSNGVTYTIKKVTVFYGHLYSVNVKQGDVIDTTCSNKSNCHTMDTPIGKMGTTGSSTGIHSHFEVRVEATGSDGWSTAKSPSPRCGSCVFVDPTPWITTGWNGSPSIKLVPLANDILKTMTNKPPI